MRARVRQQVARRALEEPIHRSPRAVVRIQRVGARGVVAHALHAVAGDRRPHRRDAGLERRRPAPGRHAVERASGRGGPVLGVIAVAVGEVGVGGHERQRRVAGHLLVGEVAEPAADGRVVALRDVAEGVGPQQIAREPHVSRGRGMADRGVDVIVVGVPAARAPVQLGLELAARAGAARPAASAPAARGSGTTRPCGPGGRPGRWPARGPEASRPSPPASSTASHSGPESRSSTDVRCRKADLLGRELGQQRVGHVVRHDAIVAAEPCDRGGGVRLIAQRHGGEIEPGRPALRAAHERVDVRGAELGPGELEQRGRLAPGHDEVARRQLEHLAMRSQAPEAAAAARTARPARAARPGADPRRGPRGRRSPRASAGPGRRRGRGRTRGRGRSADPWRAPGTRAGARRRHRRDAARPTRTGARRAAPTPAAWSSCRSRPAPPGERARRRGPPSAAGRDGRARRGPRPSAARGRGAGSTARRGAERRVAGVRGHGHGPVGPCPGSPCGERPHKGARHPVWRGTHMGARMPTATRSPGGAVRHGRRRPGRQRPSQTSATSSTS